mgnify:CR=1 FL=1
MVLGDIQTVLAIPETQYKYSTHHRIVILRVLGASMLVGPAGLYVLKVTLESSVTGAWQVVEVECEFNGAGTSRKPQRRYSLDR